MPEVVGKSLGDFLAVLLAPVYVPDIAVDTVEEAEKRRRKKSGKQGQGMQRYSKSVWEANLVCRDDVTPFICHSKSHNF